MAEERQFGKAADLAKLFDITKAAAYRLAREKRLPQGTYVYLNRRTVRFDIPALKEWIAAGGAPEQQKERAA